MADLQKDKKSAKSCGTQRIDAGKKGTAAGKTKQGKGVVKRLVREARPIYAGLALATLLSAGGIACTLAAPVYLGQLIDMISGYADGSAAFVQDLLLKACAVLLLVYAGAAFLTLGKMLLMNNTVSRFFTCTLRINISGKIARVPVSYVDRTPVGEVISRMTGDVSVMGNTIHNFLDLTVMGFFNICAIAFMMYRINAVMATIVIAVVPVSVAVSVIIAKRSERYFSSTQKSFGELYSVIEESYDSYVTVRGYNLEQRQFEQHRNINSSIALAAQKGGFLAGIIQPIIAFTNNLGYIFICLAGGYYAINGIITVGRIMEIILFARLFSQPLTSIAHGISLLQRTAASSKRVYEIMDAEEADNGGSDDKPGAGGNVRFEDVSFSYSPDRPLIENLSIDIKKGQKVAIVGPTGAGKTTIVNLLMRFYDIKGGRILVDGKDISNIKRDNVREAFAMVLQDTWLFSGTIYQNVSYGRPGSSLESVKKACESAYADHFIQTLPKGYDTVIDEASTNISGGQKQLLTIARAFLADRDILILDEATSNVDTRTEILIQRAMDKLMKDKTTFVIAHRLSTVINADIILVIDEGSIVEKGSHFQLLKQKGLYYEIYQSQYSLPARQGVDTLQTITVN